MIEPCRLPIGLKCIRDEYHKIYYMGYEIKCRSEFNIPELKIEIWTEPNIFHGFVLVDINILEIIGIIVEDKYGIYDYRLEFPHPDMNILIKKVISLYVKLINKRKYLLKENQKCQNLKK